MGTKINEDPERKANKSQNMEITITNCQLNHKTKNYDKLTKTFVKPHACNFQKSSELPYPRAFLQTLV